jgi:hypothetical protein
MIPDDPFVLLGERAPEMRPEVFEKVRELARNDSTPVQEFSRNARLIYSGVWAMILVAALSGPRIVRGEITIAVALALTSLLSVALVLNPTMPKDGSTQSTLAPPSRRLLFGVALAIVFLFFSVWAEEFHPHDAESLLSSAFACGAHGLARGILTLGILFLVWRRTDPFSPRTTAAHLGLVSGLLSVVATTMVCPIREGVHLLLGHALVVLITAAAGATLGPKLLAP